MTAVVVLAAMLASDVPLTAQVREFSSVKRLGSAMAKYDDGLMQVVVAYYHSARNHDSAWLLIQVGLSSLEPLTVRRDRVVLVTPSGREIALATQRRWGADSGRARSLLQQAQTTRHQLRYYFPGPRDAQALRFFGRPENGQTVIDAAHNAPDEVLFGDLLFESPTGGWEQGSYALVVRHDRGSASLPIELR